MKSRHGHGRDAVGATPGVARGGRRNLAVDDPRSARSARSVSQTGDGRACGPGRLLRRLDVAVRVRTPAAHGLLPETPR